MPIAADKKSTGNIRLLVCGLLIVLLGASVAQGQPAPRQASSCQYGSWTAIDTTALRREAGLFKNPRLTPSPDRLYLTANPVPHPSNLGAPEVVGGKVAWAYGLDHSLWAGTLPGLNPIPHPPGDFTFDEPVGAIGPDGALHLAWTEPHPDSLTAAQKDTAFNYLEPRRVYHARYVDETWSEPELVYQSRHESEPLITLQWGLGSPAFEVGPTGEAHLLFGLRGTGKIIYLRRSEGSWQADTLGKGLHRAVATGSGGRLAYAYSQRDFPDPRHEYGIVRLWVARSTDGGETWTRTTVLDSSEQVATGQIGSVRYAKLVGTPDDTLHIVWGRRRPKRDPDEPCCSFSEGLGVKALWHARSTDGGRTWQVSDPVSLPEDNKLHALRVAKDKCGQVHALANLEVTRSENGAGQHLLQYTRWREDEGWADLRSVAPPSSSQTHEVGPLRTAAFAAWRGRLWLVWNQEVQNGTQAPRAVLRRIRPLRTRRTQESSGQK